MPNLNINRKKILLGQLHSNGDCLHATVVARQIKHDYPDSHLTWAVSTQCRIMVENNPYVDAIWEISIGTREQWAAAWYRFEEEAYARKMRGEFDEVFLTQVYPQYEYFDGTVRPSVLRSYPHPITVPVQGIIRLRDDEIKRVKKFAEKHDLLKQRHVILFECAPQSQQSFVTPQYAVYVAQKLLTHLSDCKIILSSNIKIPSSDERIIDGSVLTLRENAELTQYCTLLIGCSSGISVIAITDWAKPLPMIQLLLSSQSMFASIAHELEYWGYSSRQMIEMLDTPPEKLLECVHCALTQGFSEARRRFHQQITIDFNFYLIYIRNALLHRGLYAKTAIAVSHAVKRYGWHPQLKAFVKSELLPKSYLNPKELIRDDDYTEILQMTISTDIHQARSQLAEQWLSMPSEQLEKAYSGNMGNVHRRLIESNLRNEALTQAENAFLQIVLTELTKRSATDPVSAMNYLLAAMLYLPSDRLKIENAETTLPRWLFEDYKKFFCE